MGSYNKMFEDFLPLCIIGCTYVHHSSSLLISLQWSIEIRPDMIVDWSLSGILFNRDLTQDGNWLEVFNYIAIVC
jgi:hypothetical protein